MQVFYSFLRKETSKYKKCKIQKKNHLMSCISEIIDVPLHSLKEQDK